jgi:hypothetical protein
MKLFESILDASAGLHPAEPPPAPAFDPPPLQPWEKLV